MKQHIESLLQIAIRHLQEKDELPAVPAFIQIDVPKGKQYGDFATNIAMILAKLAQKKPEEMAGSILSFMPTSPYIEKIEVKEPGFINFFLSSQALHDVIKKVLLEKSAYGSCKLGRGKRILVKCLFAKPIGPLCIDHGRLAVLGSVIANLLNTVGFKAFSEYYIHDWGLQVDKVSAVHNNLADIREDLAELNVHFDNWFSEKEFEEAGLINPLLTKLKQNAYVYECEGALWFRSTNFGDKRDHLLIRSDGKRTYFANDVAYHLSQFERGFDITLDIFGSDHHDYISRMKGVLQSSDINPERLIHVCIQFVMLYRCGKKMEKPNGNFLTLRELRQEVDNDAIRFFYLMRKSDKPLDFDLDLAKLQSNENPVYYVQYAYKRIIRVFKQLQERSLSFNEEAGLNHLDLLNEPYERKLMNTIARYPDMIIKATVQYEPHLLTHYLRELANDLNVYYHTKTILVEDQALRNARLALLTATKQTFLNGFNLLGLSAPG